jgi:hypothetical protein
MVRQRTTGQHSILGEPVEPYKPTPDNPFIPDNTFNSPKFPDLLFQFREL